MKSSDITAETENVPASSEAFKNISLFFLPNTALHIFTLSEQRKKFQLRLGMKRSTTDPKAIRDLWEIALVLGACLSGSWLLLLQLTVQNQQPVNASHCPNCDPYEQGDARDHHRNTSFKVWISGIRLFFFLMLEQLTFTCLQQLNAIQNPRGFGSKSTDITLKILGQYIYIYIK